MYHVDKREHKHRRFWKRAAWLSGFFILAASIYFLMNLTITPAQEIRNSPPVSKKYETSTPKKITVTKPLFTLELPAGWTETKVSPSTDGPKYIFHSPAGQAQYMNMYIDSMPPKLGLNKAIAVSFSEVDGIVHESVSDNCTTFTDATKKDPRTGFAPAKWQGIDFMCDMANFERAVVGTVSKDGPNYLNVTSPTSGVHKLLITYVDNNISPDYATLYEILDSVQFK